MQRITGSLDEGRITFGAKAATAETQVRDPVCGMFVEPSRAPAVGAYAGHSYFFCSDRCKEQFDADPERYVPAGPPAHADAPSR